jgi:thiol-disulfide isomerase/thioredoxin
VLPLPQPTHFSSVFATWLAGVLDPSAIRLSIPEQVRRVFMNLDPLILCVDCKVRLQEVPDLVPVYLVSQAAFGWFMLKTDPGTAYPYWPKDQSFISLGGNCAEESVTPILAATDKYDSKEFFCGYVLSQTESTADNDTMILTAIGTRYAERLNVVMVANDEGNEIAEKGKFARKQLPFFFMFNSNHVDEQRWFLVGEEPHDLAKVVQRVVAGTEPFTSTHSTLPEQPPSFLFREVNGLVVEQAVLKKDKATLLMLLTPSCPHCRNCKPIVNTTANLLGIGKVEFYWMDANQNDMLPAIPEFKFFPTVFMWPAGENWTTPVTFYGEKTITGLVKFIKANCGIPDFAVPEYDEQELMRGVEFFSRRARRW